VPAEQEEIKREKRVREKRKIVRMEFSPNKWNVLPVVQSRQTYRPRLFVPDICFSSPDYSVPGKRYGIVVQRFHLPYKIGEMHAPTILTSPPTPLAEWKLQIQIQQALSNKLTGLIQITFLNGRTESILARHGTVQALYVRNHRLPNLNWDIPLRQYGRGTLVIEPLPARALMFRKVIIEEITQPQPQASGTNQLKTMLSLAEHNLNPTLFHIRWEKAEGFVLVAGGRVPIRHALLITPSGLEEGNMALDHMLIWEEARCNVTIHRGDIKNQAWLELHLNILFEWYCSTILSHYGQLTGSVMVQSITRRVSMYGVQMGWNIEPLKMELKDTSLFPCAADAGAAYQKILQSIKDQIEPVIGSSLAKNLLKQSIEPTKGVYKIIQETFGLVEDVQ
jgi:hypothetical protein